MGDRPAQCPSAGGQFKDIAVYQNVAGAYSEHNKRLVEAAITTLDDQGKMPDDVLNLREIVQGAAVRSMVSVLTEFPRLGRN